MCTADSDNRVYTFKPCIKKDTETANKRSSFILHLIPPLQNPMWEVVAENSQKISAEQASLATQKIAKEASLLIVYGKYKDVNMRPDDDTYNFFWTVLKYFAAKGCYERTFKKTLSSGRHSTRPQPRHYSSCRLYPIFVTCSRFPLQESEDSSNLNDF